MLPALSIVIVSWNTRDLLRACLRSIQDTVESHEVEILVVDNASTDGSVEMVRKEFATVRMIENTENLGFARANNQAIPLCRGGYIMLLNSDTVLLPGAVEGLMKFMALNPAAAAVGPRLVNPQGTPQHGAAGYLPTLGTVSSHFLFLSVLWPRMFRGLFLNSAPLGSDPVEVEWLTGACLVVRREVFERIGGLPESYFMYVEDLDFCGRMRRAGYHLYSVPMVQVIHVGGGSSRDLTFEASTRWLTNLHRFFASDHSRANVVAFDLIAGAGLAVRTILYFGLFLVDRKSGWGAKAKTTGAASLKAFNLAGHTVLASESTYRDQL